MPTTERILPGRQGGLETARQRWSRRAAISLRNNVPMDVVRQAYLYDLDRINKGGQPMSDREAATAIASHDRLPGETGLGGEAGGPLLGPVLGFAEDAARDLKDIVMGLPQLPGFILKEPGAMGDPVHGTGQSITEGMEMLGRGDIKGLGRIAGAPGVRLIPGSFTAEMIGGGHKGEKSAADLVEHPVFTFLDLLPIASKAGLTDKALKAVAESGPYKRARQSFRRQGMGEEAAATAREIRRTQRASEEGLIVDDFMGGRFTTVEDLQRATLVRYADDFSDAEFAATVDLWELGQWGPGKPAPDWAVKSGRGPIWLEMAHENIAQNKWFRDHGLDLTKELVMIYDEVFPSTPETRAMIRRIEQIRRGGKAATVKGRDSAVTKQVKHTTKAETAAKAAAEAQSVLSGVDPIAYADEITGVIDRVDRARLPELGLADDVKAAESKALGAEEAVTEAAPRKVTVPEESPWPEDVPAMRDGERGYMNGERSPAAPGGDVELAGAVPKTEKGRLLSTVKRIDGRVVAEHAAEIVKRHDAAEARLVEVANEVGMNPRQARAAIDELQGKVERGSVEDLVRDMNEAVEQPVDLTAKVEVPVREGTNLEGTRTITELDLRVETLMRDGYENVVIDGANYHRLPSKVTTVKAARADAVRRRGEQQKAAELKGALKAGSEEAATRVEGLVEETIRTDVRAALEPLQREADSLRATHDPSDYRIAHETDLYRPGLDYPTHITVGEKNLIRRGELTRLAVDGDGMVWEIYEPSSEVVGKWTGRRKVGDDWEWKDFTDETLDQMAIADDWIDVDRGSFEVTATEGFSEAQLNTAIDEMVAASKVPAGEAFVVVDGRQQSVAAARVLERAREVLPDRVARTVGRESGEVQRTFTGAEETARLFAPATKMTAEGVKVPRVAIPEGMVEKFRPDSGWDKLTDMAAGVYDDVRIVDPEAGTAAIAETNRIIASHDARLAELSAAAEATVAGPRRVLAAVDELNAVKQLQRDLQAKVEKGTVTRTERVRKGGVHPDEARLRQVYDTLDDIESTGSTHPLHSAKESFVEEAARLEAAGIRVKPTQRKLAADMGTRTKRVDAGDATRHTAAKGASKEAKASLKGVKGLRDKVVGSFKTLQSEVAATLREAETLARTGEYTKAREKLLVAQKKFATKGVDPLKRRLKAHAPGLLDELDQMERQITALRERIPTTDKVKKARARIDTLRRNEQKAKMTAEGASAKAKDLTELMARELTEAQLHEMKWRMDVKNIPDRWHPLWRHHLEKKLAEKLGERNAPPEAVQSLMYGAMTDAAKKAGLTSKELNVLKKDAWATVIELADQGVQPIWFPHRSLGNRGRAPGKMLGQRLSQPQQFKARTMLNPEPYVKNVAVALSQNAMDFMREAGTEAFFFGKTIVRNGVDESITGIFKMFGESFDDLTHRYADEIAAQKARNPWESDAIHAKRVIDKDWVTIDPRKWGISDRWSPEFKMKYKRKAVGLSDEAIDIQLKEVYVPIGVSKTLEAQAKVGGLVPYRGVYDKVMDVFRVSALALSPRFLVYNAIGGMPMLMARTDPTVLAYLGRTPQMVDDGTLPVGISKGAAMVDPDLVRKFQPDLRKLATDKRTGFLWGMEEGQWLGSVFRGVQKGANKSFALNEWFDQVYRSAAYLYEMDRVVAKGGTQTAAAEAGIKLSNKILQDWDAMLPWERVAMRRIFPFYGWMKHVLKYTFTLPYDHPMRVAVLTNYAAAEMEDYRTGIPQWLAHTFFIGKEGPDTKQWSISARALNPFSDVARLVDFDRREYGSGVLVGFFTQTSPLIGAVGETLGINSMSGRPSLYPEMVYDPDRGRLRAEAPNILQTLPSAIIPQIQGVQGIAELAGVSALSGELRQLRQRDPDAFASRIWGAFGTPMAPRRRSRSFEMMRSGFAQEQASSDAVNRALRTGDWSDALGYEEAHIRGQSYNVRSLYDLAKRNPELLEVILSAGSSR